MKKLLFLVFILTVTLIAWDSKECEHIYAAVEQPEIQVSQTVTMHYGTVQTLTGKRKGIEIVCVKCLYKTRQILDYGESNHTLNSIPFISVIQTEGILFTDTVRK